MPLALLVTLVGVTLSAGLTTVVVGQIKDSKRVTDRLAAVTAAQAGLDAGLAKIRAAMTAGSGDITKLPCTPFSDTIPASGGGGPSTYRASVGYFLVDPSGMVGDLAPLGDLTNLNALAAGTSVTALFTSLGRTPPADTSRLTNDVASVVGCVADHLASQVPLFGLLQSTGTSGTVTRTLYATYTFHTAEEQIPGGHIAVANTSPRLCLGDNAPVPAPGDLVNAVLCSTADSQGKLIYPKNLSLELALSRAKDMPYGLCLSLGQQNNAYATWQKCVTPKDKTQQWRFDADDFSYYGTKNGRTDSGCLTLENPGAVNSRILLGNSCASNNSNGHNFNPDPTVGAGSSGTNTQQFVNYSEVGRCLDLTKRDVNGTWFTQQSPARPRALITYPCKQAFDPADLYWNHKWTPVTVSTAPDGTYVTQTLSVTPPAGYAGAGVPYCMTSPGAAGGRVWVTQCSTGGTALQWKVYGAMPLTAESYRVVDQYGNCLQAAGTQLGDAYLMEGWSEVLTAPCNGSQLQQWNVPASFGAGPLKGLQEK